MRIAHTSDWHAGRIFKQVPRLPELVDVLANLGDDLERERIDLLLMSGDVFDSGAPTAEAERAVFGFFKRVGRAGIRTVVIAGNHDSAARMDAWGALTELVDVHVVGRPRSADDGGLLRIETRDGGRALVAAVPFAAPRYFASALQMAEDDAGPKQRYADGMRAIVANVTAPFDARAINLLMLHTHLTGAVLSGSEREVHLGDEWAATPQALPATAHYVALGHIHKPQPINAPSPAAYAGSPLQMDFGEEGEEKGWVLVNAVPGQPAAVERVPYRGGTPLVKVTASLLELERDAGTLATRGHLWVTVPLTTPEPDLSSRVRRLLPNAVKVQADLPKAKEGSALVPAPGTAPRELYRAYYTEAHEAAPTDELLAAFDALRDSVAEP
jgi:exonuclease SbcD